ncbi:acidic mammalian chitinase-like [Xiphias gladius]|uniref:acidic mammalian chitinase-like n=1 Tax=Xiphias gladius TaxID=8245 RepID=UPI001A9815A5|nr:acidic mammalian chitinase-like [Xiphias gladius]
MSKLILIAGLCVIISTLASSSKLVCYYNSWSENRIGEGKFTLLDVDPNLCTHLIFAFSGINDAHELVPNNRSDLQSYITFNELKLRNPNLKTLLAVGGWTFGTQKFSAMVATAANRQKFILSSITLLRTFGFDGINLDWQFPGTQGGHPLDKERFTLLCEELLCAYEDEGIETGRPRLLVTAAVAADKEIIDASYEVAKISKYLDFINVMTYDFHGNWDWFTGHHSPLYSRPQDTGSFVYLNTDFALRYWQDQGVAAEKLILGFAAYGRTFTLSSLSSEVGAPISNVGHAGLYTEEAGLWSYYEVCLYLEGKTVQWIEHQNVPCGSTGNQWVGFDNKESIYAKVNYLTQNNFGGVFVWSLDLDDFKGQFCKQGKYPLISYLHSLLVSGLDKTFCVGKPNDLFPNPNDPGSFFQCFNGKTYFQVCQPNLVFQESCKCCKFPNSGVDREYYYY